MERDLNNDEFEIFLKQKADQHKLYPSDKAWKGIYNSLHPGMKWFKVGGSLLILSTLFIVYQETSLFNSSDLTSKATNAPAVIQAKQSNLNNSPGSNQKSNKGVTIFRGLSSNSSVQTKEAVATPGSFINSTKPSVDLSSDLAAFENKTATRESRVNNSATANSNLIATSSNSTNKAGSSIGRASLTGLALRNINSLSLTSPALVRIPVNHKDVASSKQTEQPADLASADNGVMRPLVSTSIGDAITNESEGSVKDINWLQEMAAIRLTAPKKSKFNLQFYFSPTVSYRRLVDNQNTSHSSIIGAPSVSRDLNINRYVDHNPAIGAELGSNMLFSLTRSLTLKSGVQLNYSRYNIKAFKSHYEKASIALNNGGAVPDTISSYTSLRNFNGYASEDLQNQYLQVSVPIGAELKLIGNKRLQFSVAGTIQPTFLLFSDTYLLSTNYLNYTKEPSLVRKWNFHSSFEAFLSYKTGGLRWQLGPQFRYQLMSSFNDNYPIKEYLLEYGVKIGVSKTIR